MGLLASFCAAALAHEDGSAVVASLGAPFAVDAPELHASRSTGETDPITIVLAGDTGLNGSDQPTRSDGALRHGSVLGFDDLAARIAPLMTGDLNFANLETVVSARSDLRALDKLFSFRSHPDGVAALVRAGLNVVSTANNHVFDYGPDGARDTITHLARLDGLKAAPGLGLTRADAGRAWPVDVKGARITFAALGIGPGGYFGRRDADRPGQMAFSSPEDFEDTVQSLEQAASDYRVLSVHYGSEMQVRPSPADARRLGDVVARGKADLVVGHHAHVPAGVQRIGEKLVLFGLGNFQHPGMRDLDGLGVCRDWGLIVRVHLSRNENGGLTARAIEAVPLTRMHDGVEQMAADKARQRISVLNHLAAGLDDAKSGVGVRFSLQEDGTGLACFEGAERLKGRIGSACRSDRPVATAAGISCGAPDLVARRDGGKVPVRAVFTGKPSAASSSWASAFWSD